MLSATSILVDKFHVIGRKETECSIWTESLPPALVNLINVCDDVAWVKGYLCGISCKEQHNYSALQHGPKISVSP